MASAPRRRSSSRMGKSPNRETRSSAGSVVLRQISKSETSPWALRSSGTRARPAWTAPTVERGTRRPSETALVPSPRDRRRKWRAAIRSVRSRASRRPRRLLQPRWSAWRGRAFPPTRDRGFPAMRRPHSLPGGRPASLRASRSSAASRRPTIASAIFSSSRSFVLARQDRPAVAQHGDAIGQRHHFVEEVRHKQDRLALDLRQPAHGLVDEFPFVGRQRSRRLVHDDEPSAGAERLEDRHHLPLTDREFADDRRRDRGDSRPARRARRTGLRADGSRRQKPFAPRNTFSITDSVETSGIC